MSTSREGGRILVEQLVIHGVDTVFSVPGESFLPVLDGLHEHRAKVKLVTCRHESGAANMAEAHGKLTGRPGICFVTRGPGATQASVGVHTAFQDSTPMILFVGDVGSGFRDREAFQEVDFTAMFAPLAKWVARIDSVERIPEYVNRAFTVAMSRIAPRAIRADSTRTLRVAPSTTWPLRWSTTCICGASGAQRTASAPRRSSASRVSTDSWISAPS